MNLCKHRRRQTFLSAHNFCARHIGVWRGVVEWHNGYTRYIRYPYSYVGGPA